MLDKNEVYSMPGSVVTKTLRSFMKTFMIGIRKREADCSCVENFYVKALSVDGAFKVGEALVGPSGYIVKDVISPGSDLYGIDEICSCMTDTNGNVNSKTTTYSNGNVF